METDTFQRMIDELNELNSKLTKIRAFVEDKEKFEKLDYLNRDLLISQYKAMEAYLSILSVRIGLNAPKQPSENKGDIEANGATEEQTKE